ncbi:hypothetical protein [Croceicoccus naphthovorans]|uniref:Uncharacterized protein n=1 Tax=Croceicoccus naphthovorans TaxID=1348774 RepID=A0A0G3XHR5_9SPHN|nr:hypothetical protein [Croceicoccus naphthovorans]AKM09943.1 hypothetical protein AB433_08080 [Croceicoccus naphthovorans]MBB3990897.1 hypothetical protein [Croceicoccus naphthovorans]
MNLIALRKASRLSLAVGSVAIIAGALMMYFDWVDLGDGVMITGLAMLIIGALALSKTPTGDKDAG